MTNTVPFLQPPLPSTLAFVAIVVAVLAAAVAAVFHAERRQGGPAARRARQTVVGLAAYLGLVGAVVRSGALAEQPMPRLMLFFLTLNLCALAFALSPVGRSLALHTPLRALVAFQAFRLPLELILHAWAQGGHIPTSMTWNGANLDVITGILALAATPWANRRWVAWPVNAIGLALLMNVMRVAVLSSPLPFAWPVEPPLALAFHLPYAWIGAVCVAGALAGHVILFRALLMRPDDLPRR